MNEGRALNVHEVGFCGHVATMLQAIFEKTPDCAFREARIETFSAKGRGHASKREDLNFLDHNGKPIITGEAKLPGTREGRSPFADELVREAQEKADHAGARWFFTWNVNTFVLWDRRKWDKPLLERRVAVWELGLLLNNSADVERATTTEYLRTKFLPPLVAELNDIVQGRGEHRWLAPDDLFIKSIESHLEWPVRLTSEYLESEASRKGNKKFDTQLQQWMTEMGWTFVREQPDDWREALHRAASSLAYVLINRIIFYKALRDRFGDLPQLKLPSSIGDADKAYAFLQKRFQQAVDQTGDYEPLLYPDVSDWASTLAFAGGTSLDAWRSVLAAVDSYDFKNIASDVVGRIFQRLIGPEERHRFGQHFTTDDPADLINAFCVRAANAKILDPACGSGSFLVRAYYRKKTRDPSRTHEQLISELFGCDISLFPAHLATLNLAAREIKDEANYPRIARRDFFGVEPDAPFCNIPKPGTNKPEPVPLPELDAVVGNPPYVRQENFTPVEKKRMLAVGQSAFPELKLSGRSDVHCYFWPAAARLLRPDGYFGFITSSQWLDVEYGFKLQAWMLSNFRIIAVLESTAEPWFTDARVKTCITILKRETNEAARTANVVKFVQLRKPLIEIIGVPAGADEHSRQKAVEKLREYIERCDTDFTDERMRIIIKPQGELWREGCAAIRGGGTSGEDEDFEGDPVAGTEMMFEGSTGGYVAGKWGRFLRAPDLYFEMMNEFRPRFARLGELAEVRFGVKSGCDAFFMPRDDSAKALSQFEDPKVFKQEFGPERADVASGRVAIVRDGNDQRFPVEAEFVQPEIHSLMNIERPVIRAGELDRVVLLVGKPLSTLKGKWVGKYIAHGAKEVYSSNKSKPVPVPERSTCKGREPWYDLTKLVKPGFGLWPMAQQYRHIVPENPDRLICNHNMFDLGSSVLSGPEERVLVGVLNSTLVALWKTFYGRYAGTEGNLKTEVVDVNLLEVPDPRGCPQPIARDIVAALDELQQRPIGRMVEEQLMDCHSPERAKLIAEGPLVLANELKQPDRRRLDDAVLRLLGINDSTRRAQLIDRLYAEVARQLREIRKVEIIKSEQKSKSKARKFGADELAADVWDSASQKLRDLRPTRDWLAAEFSRELAFDIPQGVPRLKPRNDQFEATIVYFGKDPKNHLNFPTREHAEIVELIARHGFHGEIELPKDQAETWKAKSVLADRLAAAHEVFTDLAGSRASDEDLRQEIVGLTMRWFVCGRPSATYELPVESRS